MRLCAYVEKLVESLPLPAGLPPVQVGPARRLDNTAEIRELAKQWRNCLEDEYLSLIDKGTCCVYFWDDPDIPAIFSVKRFGRLGWFLEDVKGPQNASLPCQRFSRLRKAFANIGVPQVNVAHSIEAIVDLNDDARRRRSGVRA